uniref:AB hydrolase-1 domain-containing protein n=1 Tax=Rhodosorus marinus TaxID=101924 RepID=A0A7S2ZU70_9RHOD|mmetsp:Transcript_31883/g.123729  ORF Transcript_31883/g.123729 Transcript_31883/m.123729 type:complete len:178 (+) Transcript_31883:585-1118(+)
MGLQVEVVNDGGAETIVFISGWPDTPRLWDKAVEEFSNEYRCVSIGLPMYSSREEAKALGVYRKSGYNMDEVVDMIAETIDESCRGHFPITLCIFDWGCVYGFQYIGKHSEKVCRTIAIDVGPVWMKAPRFAPHSTLTDPNRLTYIASRSACLGCKISLAYSSLAFSTSTELFSTIW